MTDSATGTWSGRSFSQSKYGFTTMDFGMKGALSLSLRTSGSAKVWPNTASSQRTSPSTALAYGSMRSLAGLDRWPWIGSQAPCTRKPYRWPGPMSGR